MKKTLKNFSINSINSLYFPQRILWNDKEESIESMEEEISVKKIEIIFTE